MIRHFLIAFKRVVIKNQLSFLIKSVGLVLSLAVTVLIAAYIYDEFLFDRFHEDAESVFRITTTSNFNGNENAYSRTPLSLAERLSEVKSIQSVARIFRRSATISIPETDVKFNETFVWFADSSITNIFSFAVLHGNLSNVLRKPNSMIITKEAARKYFSTDEVIGKTLLLENAMPFQIDAVVENFPEQSTFQFEFIVPFNRFLDLENPGNVQFLTTDWLYTPVHTFIKVSSGTTHDQINVDLLSIIKNVPDERVKENVKYSAQALPDIHLYSEFTGEQTNPRIVYVYVFAAIGFTLFIIAIINFISLTSAEWIARQKELRIRRIMGSSKKLIAGQFLMEGFLFSILLLPMALLISYLLLPSFNNITQKQLLPELFMTWPVVITIVGAVIIYLGCTGLFMSIPSQTEKPNEKLPSRLASNLPPSLLFQAMLTFVIACFSITAYRQLNFIENKSLGFQKDNLIIVPLFSENFNSILGQITGDFRGRMNYFEEEILKHDAVETITASAFQPGQGSVMALVKTDSLKDADNTFVSLNSVDYDFLDTYKVRLLAGRKFSKDFGTDHVQAFIMNEEAVRTLGFNTPDDAIGKNIEAVGKQGQVVGVMENFHFEGLQNPIRPLLLEVAAWKFTTFSIRLNENKRQQGIEILIAKWKEIFPETAFQYTFLEDDLATNYQFESSLSKLTQGVSILTVLLSLLGIYASASHLSLKKVKELTMRRVLGATSRNLIRVFTKPFVRVLFIAFLISLPVAWKLCEAWLSSFAYRTSLQVMDLLMVFGVACMLVTLVLARQLVNVVNINPVDNLRRE
jgi:putative ABC transport system permease protein